MARARAADYDGKRKAILHRSAGLFAKHGYDRASMANIAQACGASKALLYHYYDSKVNVPTGFTSCSWFALLPLAIS